MLSSPERLLPSMATAVTTETIFNDRYRVLRPLKQANGIETLLATDLQQEQLVVIKSAPDECLSAGAQMRLEHEAKILREVRGHSVAPLLHFGREGHLLYLVMPFVAGITLEQRLNRGCLTVGETLTIGRCLLEALQEVHAHGVLHRDLKPANIIVDREESLRHATLIDFGLARSSRLDASIRDQPVGTARYMSPEQAGLLDHGCDERSDLYSVGVILFECLAGRPPFAGDSIGQVLRQHMTLAAPELRSLGVAIPRALDDIVQRLLRKDPRDRYQSAAPVLADLSQLARALERGESDPPIVVGLHDRRRTLTEPVFIGRGPELAALDMLVDRTCAGDGGLAYLEAESGGGKTRILDELARRAAQKGVWVLRGQGVDQTALRPFQVLFGVAAEVLAQSQVDETCAETLRAHLGDQCPAACAVFPELGAILGSDACGALGPESFGPARSLQALAILLDAVGCADRPALVLLDDCQWADELTLKLLGQWQRKKDAFKGQRHVLVVVAFRTEEVPPDHALRALPPAPHLPLTPFGADDVRRLAESMAGPLPEEALTLVERFSEGSPFLATAVLQGMVESGALVGDATGWRIEPLAMADVQSSRHAAAFLARRIDLLPTDVLSLLAAGAILGKEFDLEFAAALCQQTPAQAIAALDEARRRQLVWAKTQGMACSFVHDKLRQTLLDRLPAAETKELHLRAALRFETLHPERVFELAYHFDAAGQSNRALSHALDAAARARERHALQLAEQHYEIAARGVDPQDEATRLRIAEGLGNVFMLRGRYKEAAEQFEAALALARDDVAQAEIDGKLGELAFKRGDVAAAEARIARALDLLGRPVPRWSAMFGLLAVWELFIQLLHTILPWFFLSRRRVDGAATELLAIRLYSRLAHLFWFHRGSVAALWAHLRELNLAERYPPTPELAQAYSEHAPAMSLIPFFRRGIAYAEKSLAIRKELNDLWGQGQSLHFHGVVLYAASRFRECIAKCREAIRLLERTGDFWEVNIARFQVAASLYRLGDLAGAAAEARAMYQSGVDLGDAQASGISLDVWARATRGQLPPDFIQRELRRPSADAQRSAQVMMAEGVRLLNEGNPAAAADILAQAASQIRKAGVRNAWVAPVLPWLTTALRCQLQQNQFLTPSRRISLWRRACRAARQSLRLAWHFQNELPHALREMALHFALAGHYRAARRYFRKSLAVAQRQGAIYEHAQTLHAQARVGVELHWRQAGDQLQEAQQILAGLEANTSSPNYSASAATAEPASLSLADRFDTVLDTGRRIASALSRAAIFAAMRDAAAKLLRGDRCLLLKVGAEAEGENVTTASDEIQTNYSQSLVQRALKASRAVTLLEGVSDQSTESVLLFGMRSALCVPVFARGRAVVCIYVTHQQVAGLFGPAEERLADFIATLGGAALENAEGFAELRRLNETLENQISESRRAEKRIQEQAALLDKASDAICVLGLDDCIQYWNQSAEALYGWSAAEALGQRASELLFRGASTQVEGAAKILLERGDWSGELRQFTRAGNEIVVQSRWSLVRDESGRPKATLVVSTNVTEKKRLEAQFLRAQRMESIGTLAGGVAHDINNILTPIMMGVDMLRMDIAPAQRLTVLSQMESCAQRGAEMVKQILSFARGVGGQRVQFAVKHIVREIETMLRGTFPKSIEIRTNVPADLAAVCGDATQLSQMLMNLCVNARDAMPLGGRLIVNAANIVLDATSAARLHPDAKAGPYVLLHIEDTGTGIAPDVMEKIFDPFFTTKEFGKGTGLGLSTVQGIVKSHGGFINVASTLGRGTQFTVYLPALPHAAAKEPEAKSAVLTRGRGELILVVDDEAFIRQIAQKNLEAHGYCVLAARNGREALPLYAEHCNRVRLLVTDMMMPGMDGPATVRAVRAVNPKLPVIAVSGLPASHEEAEKSGLALQAFLPKPFTVEQLLLAVQGALREPQPPN